MLLFLGETRQSETVLWELIDGSGRISYECVYIYVLTLGRGFFVLPVNKINKNAIGQIEIQ